ncbi:MAG: type II secretion system protein GspG [Polyangiales bacterium]
MAWLSSRPRRRQERTIFLPWERRKLFGGLRLPRRRLRAVFILLAAYAIYSSLRASERRARDVRVTRNSIALVAKAIDRYRADHSGQCPPDLDSLTRVGEHAAYLRSVPSDAWKRPLRLSCPGLDPTRPFELLSDGADGLPYGLDRVL